MKTVSLLVKNNSSKKNDKQQAQQCETCFKIICKQCGWEANEKETRRIQSGQLSACPVCGWKPGENIKSIL